MATAVSFESLATAFRHRNFQPLYFFYGEESLLMDELQALLVEHALQEHERPFNLDVVHGPEADVRAVLAACASYPVMAERRVVIVRGFDRLAENRSFTSYAERPNPHAVVMLICSGKPNLSAHPYRALREHGVACEFKPLSQRQMPGWIDQRVRMHGYRIESGAAQMLSEQLGAGLQLADTEIEKLIAFAGERTTITESDVLHAGGQTRELNVFELQRALGQADRARALTIADRMIRQASNRRGEALMMVSVLAGYFTRLWKLSVCLGSRVAEKEMAGQIGVPPFAVAEYVLGFRKLGIESVRRGLEALLAADFELKGGSTRNEQLVLALVIERILPDRESGHDH
jgi:DNA polymerase III subunit delta